MSYQPPFNTTDRVAALSIEIAEMVGKLSPESALGSSPQLHRKLRIQTIHSSLAIEQNSLTEGQVTDIIDGKRVLGPSSDIMEVENARRAYDLLGELDPESIDDLLRAHGVMMDGLCRNAGTFRSKNAGVFDGELLVHASTPATYVPEVMADLFNWLKCGELHPLIASCVFHYEFEFIHPFSDGNGRTGRLWHTLMLSRWRSSLAWLPVESMIRARQEWYYAAFNASNTEGSATPFVLFMLEAIRDAMKPYCSPGAREDLLKERVVRYIGEHPAATALDIASAAGSSKRTVERIMSALKQEGVVRRVGGSRGGHWEIARDDNAN